MSDGNDVPRRVKLISRGEIYANRERFSLMEMEAGLKHLDPEAIYKVSHSQKRQDGTIEIFLKGTRWRLPLSMFRPVG